MLPKKIVCLGDSITANSENVSYVDEWQKLTDITIIGSGVNGETAAGGLDRLESDVLVHNPDLVTVCYGHNEVHGMIPVTEYRNNLASIVQAILDTNSQVWLMTPTQIADKEMAKRYEPYLRVVEEVAGEFAIHWVDLWHIFDSTPLDQIFTYQFEDMDLDGYDYLHPNSLGHQLIAQRLQQEFESHNYSTPLS